VINKKIILIGILLSFLLVLPSFSEDLSSVASAKGDLSLQDIIQNIQSNQSQINGTTEKVPAKARLGVAVKPAKGLLNNSTLALDLAQTLKSNYAAELSAGYEWSKDGLSLRAGYTESVFTAGAGFRSGVAQIDYAYVQQTSLSKENVHRISLSGKW